MNPPTNKLTPEEQAAEDQSNLKLGAGCVIFVIAVGTLALMFLTLRAFGVF